MGWLAGVRSGLCQHSMGYMGWRGGIQGPTRSTLGSHGLGTIGIVADGAAMADGRRSGKAIHIYGIYRVLLGPSVAHVAAVLVLEKCEEERVEVGHVVVNPLLTERIISADIRWQAATSSRTGSERHGSQGTCERRPSLCTSVSVIGLSLAAPKERMEMRNRGCDTRSVGRAVPALWRLAGP
eukprot:scaffold9295_cov122-Isochrysis_galbana.AAC.7